MSSLSHSQTSLPGTRAFAFSAYKFHKAGISISLLHCWSTPNNNLEGGELSIKEVYILILVIGFLWIPNSAAEMHSSQVYGLLGL